MQDDSRGGGGQEKREEGKRSSWADKEAFPALPMRANASLNSHGEEKDGVENPSRVGLSKRPTLDICLQEVTNWKLRGRSGTSEINRKGASLVVPCLRRHTSNSGGHGFDLWSRI